MDLIRFYKQNKKTLGVNATSKAMESIEAFAVWNDITRVKITKREWLMILVLALIGAEKEGLLSDSKIVYQTNRILRMIGE